MHELTVALRIRQALEAELVEEPELVATSVSVQVGALAGIVPEALEFAWSHAVADSPLLAESRIDIEWVDVSGICSECQVTRTITNLQSFRCRVCGQPIEQIVGGDELEILTVDVCDRIVGPS